MIFALVTFVPHAKGPMSAADRLKLIEATAPRYQTIPGLIRKYFMGQPGGRAGGGYEWETKAHADAFYTAAWRADMTAKYGTDLRVEYFDCPAVVDNAAGTINIAAELRGAAAAG
jgi:hypothetical protein